MAENGLVQSMAGTRSEAAGMKGAHLLNPAKPGLAEYIVAHSFRNPDKGTEQLEELRKVGYKLLLSKCFLFGIRNAERWLLNIVQQIAPPILYDQLQGSQPVSCSAAQASLKHPQSIMCSPPESVPVLQILLQLMKARTVVEVGVFTGAVLDLHCSALHACMHMRINAQYCNDSPI